MNGQNMPCLLAADGKIPAYCEEKAPGRLKHRSLRRKRHALQRRQLTEFRPELPGLLLLLIDQIHTVPRRIMNGIVPHLQAIYGDKWIFEAFHLQEQALETTLGSDYRRPLEQEVVDPTQEHLRRRLRLLSGTLHLKVRRIWADVRSSEDERLEEIRAKVHSTLQTFEASALQILQTDRGARSEDELEEVMPSATVTADVELQGARPYEAT
ncbi:unnamed protein product [Durusdinium trenchii]|uniref:Uncharacterized protein n=3 Tax=Durusdinium trenchii TaxID=1381693 RepID=A0ABP0HR48_9DINO